MDACRRGECFRIVLFQGSGQIPLSQDNRRVKSGLRPFFMGRPESRAGVCRMPAERRQEGRETRK